MVEVARINPERARLEPESEFAHPIDVVSAPTLTRGQKIAILKRWEHTLLDRLKATDEGMAPPAGVTAKEAATIEEIARALRLIQDSPSGE